MKTIKEVVKEYNKQLQKGEIQLAYRGIMAIISKLNIALRIKYPDYNVSSVYLGYMDMTYFAFTKAELKRRNLKVAIVYLHQKNSFELWLSGINRKVQGEYISIFKERKIGYKLSESEPGVDSILEKEILVDPNFDDFQALIDLIEKEAVDFNDNIIFKLL